MKIFTMALVQNCTSCVQMKNAQIELNFSSTPMFKDCAFQINTASVVGMRSIGRSQSAAFFIDEFKLSLVTTLLDKTNTFTC